MYFYKIIIIKTSQICCMIWVCWRTRERRERGRRLRTLEVERSVFNDKRREYIWMRSLTKRFNVFWSMIHIRSNIRTHQNHVSCFVEIFILIYIISTILIGMWNDAEIVGWKGDGWKGRRGGGEINRRPLPPLTVLSAGTGFGVVVAKRGACVREGGGVLP